MSDLTSRSNTLAANADLGIALFESSLDCVKLIDLQGCLLSMNRNGKCAMEIDDFGALAGRPWVSLWPAEAAEQVNRAVQTALAGQSGHFVAFCPSAKGMPKWWDVSVTPVIDEDGRVERVLSISRDITAARQAEHELRASHARFSALLESSIEGIYGLGPDNVCTFINGPGAAMLGYTPAELIGRELHSIIHHHHADGTPYPIHDCRLSKAAEQGLAVRIEDEVFWHKDGRAVPVSYAVAPMAGPGAAGAVVTFADITQRQQNLAALEASTERLRLATDAAQFGLWSWDPAADQVVWENERLYQILGVPLSDGPINPARFTRDLLHPDDVAGFEQAVAGAFSNDRAFQFQCRIRRPDGTTGWVELHGRTQRHGGAMAARMVGTLADITVRKEAEQALFESRERLGTIISQAATGVVQTDVDTRITLANQKFCAMLGYSEGELIGTALADVTDSESHSLTRETLDQLMVGGPPQVIEKRYVRSDGSTLWATSSVSALRGPDGTFQGVVAIVVDVTERKAAEEKLREADRRKDEFLAMLAHELRNPLAPIGAAAELIKTSKVNQATLRQTSEIISRQVRHMTHLIDDLLDVSRVTRGLVKLEQAPLDMRAIVGDAVEQVRPLILAKQHQLALHLTGSEAPVRGDNKRLVQIVSNLLHNAAKYTAPGGAITLRMEADNATVRLTVADNGIGIEPQLASRVFDLFTQAEHAPDRSSGGLGLGLALVKNLVELHGGSVACFSRGPGEGSLFSVTLPRLPAASLNAVKAAPALPALRHTGSLDILLVDDNVDAATALGMLLEVSDYRVTIAHSAHAALEAAAGRHFDACLLDIGLPEMDGYELARRLRSDPLNGASVLVAITGYGQESDRKQSADAGFDHHFIKPVDSDKLLGLLSTIG